MAFNVSKIVRSDSTNSAQVTVSFGDRPMGIGLIQVDNELGWKELEDYRASGELAVYVAQGGFADAEEVQEDTASADDWRVIYPA
jgi:hypothetical protein